MLSAVLGNKEIKKRMGKEIFIHPFHESKLKGASYNLTASKIAFLQSTKELCINEKGDIIVPPFETVLIQTNESIYVRKNICGTYHSRVSLVSKGLTHIGTTLDPGYLGKSVISMTNITKEPIIIDAESPIVTLMFYKVKGCDKEAKDNTSNRDDLVPKTFSGFTQELSDEQKNKLLEEIKEFRNQEWWDDYTVLIKEVRNNIGFKLFKGNVVSMLIIFVLFVGLLILYCKQVIQTVTFVPVTVSLVIATLPCLRDIFDKIRK